MKVERRTFLTAIVLSSLTSAIVRASSAPRPIGKLVCKGWMDHELDFEGQYKLTAALVCEEGSCWLYTPMRFGSLGFLFSVKDESGKWLDTPNAPQPHPFVPQLPIQASSFVRLDAGMLIGTYIEGKVRDTFPKPGEYTVSTTYMSPILKTEISETEATLRQNATTREDGTLFAPLVSVKIRS